MKKAIVYLFSIILVLGINSCAKDGGDGPMGPEGKQGVEGKQGIPGTDGKMLISGNGAPAASLGAAGDFYIDITNSNLYGPKTATSWGNAASMQGATGPKGDKGAKGDAGAKGRDGSQFLSGTVAPGAAVGAIGDFYFNTLGGILFGPKASSGWGAGTNLKGVKGDKGDKGDAGNANVRSTGWQKLPTNKWSNTTAGYKSPRDITNPFMSNSAFAIGSIDGVVLVYVRGLKAVSRATDIMLLPVMDRVVGGGKTGGIELRFKHLGDVNYALWCDISVGLQTGEWDANYIKNTYLPSLEWKVVQIPPMVAKAHERGLTKVNLNNYEDVADYFNLEN